MTTTDHDQLLDDLFAAIQRGDVDAVGPMYTDDVEVWHNVTQRALRKEESLDLLRFWVSRVTDMRYEVLERNLYDGGAVQRHVVHGTADGTTLAAPIAIVFRFAEGKISHIWEYLDPAAVAAVFPSR